jgi:hypothetical protein
LIGQTSLPFRQGRGGARKGAGRKPQGEHALLRHETRAKVARHVLRYVFGNAHKHFEQGKGPKVEDLIDLFSSAPWFDGFVESITVRNIDRHARPTASPSTWLLRTGWRKHGLLSIHERPKVV